MEKPFLSPTEFARKLRREPMLAERALWLELKNSALVYKFSRQICIGSYLVDFCSRQLKLVVELDCG